MGEHVGGHYMDLLPNVNMFKQLKYYKFWTSSLGSEKQLYSVLTFCRYLFQLINPEMTLLSGLFDILPVSSDISFTPEIGLCHPLLISL